MSTDLRTLPRTAEPIGEAFFGILWADGHETVFEAAYLRERCPCAACRGGSARPAPALTLPVAGQPGSGLPLGFERVEPMGRYALRFGFTDRHDSGIFDFELLRALCPCEACAAEAGGRAGDRTRPAGNR
jgi:DUF971 family protein